MKRRRSAIAEVNDLGPKCCLLLPEDSCTGSAGGAPLISGLSLKGEIGKKNYIIYTSDEKNISPTK